MNIEFNPANSAINTKKHGVSLLFGTNVFSDEDMLAIPTIRVEDGERRFRAIGMVTNRLWTVIFVVRNGRHRFISVRKSNVSETRTYNCP